LTGTAACGNFISNGAFVNFPASFLLPLVIPMPFSPVTEILEEMRAGRIVVVVDDEDRENEGDLTMAAEKVTPEAINFMAKHGRGLVCLALTEEKCDALELPPMVLDNRSQFGTAFTVSIEAREGVTTGISAHDRATTILTVVRDDCKPGDLVRPGHIFPLRARDGGVLVRAGQTEASVDLARLAGLRPSGVICEVMSEDGTMARVPQLREFCKKHGLKMCSVAALIRYRRKKERLIKRGSRIKLPTRFGEFTLIYYSSVVDKDEHLALCAGLKDDEEKFACSKDDAILTRVHSECLTGDIFHSLRCDCGEQLEKAMSLIAAEGRGILLYMRQEGRGIGLENKLRAYELQEHGHDTVEANEMLGFKPDERDYGIGAQILVDLGAHRLRLLSNNPRKYKGLEGYGLSIAERISLQIKPTEKNIDYLKTKKEKLGHVLDDL